MTDDDRKPGAGWDLVEDLLAEEEIERQRAIPAEERRAAMKAKGIDPDRAHAVANEVLVKLGLPGVAATAPPAPAEAPKVVSLAAAREKRRLSPRWTIALVAAAIAVVLAGGGGALVALNTPSPSATTPIPTAPPGPSPEELAQQQQRAKAEELRKVAATECGAEKWDACGKSLAKAAKLDPQGEESRRVRRLEGKAERGVIQDSVEVKLTPDPRLIRAEARPRLESALAASKGQALRLVCSRAPEPSRLCDELVAALTSAGWAVTRTALPAAAPDAAAFHGMLVEVATDADETTQAAADVLARGLETAFLIARGPDDVAPGDAPLRLTIGPQ